MKNDNTMLKKITFILFDKFHTFYIIFSIIFSVLSFTLILILVLVMIFWIFFFHFFSTKIQFLSNKWFQFRLLSLWSNDIVLLIILSYFFYKSTVSERDSDGLQYTLNNYSICYAQGKYFLHMLLLHFFLIKLI